MFKNLCVEPRNIETGNTYSGANRFNLSVCVVGNILVHSIKLIILVDF
jgi:hypothetical protein